MGQEILQETYTAAAKIAPAIAGATWTAITLNQLVAAATLIYIVLQIGLLIPKYIKIYKKWRQRK